LPPSIRFEKALFKQGFKSVAGVDEAGRGPLAGPVVAAAVVFPPGAVKIKGLRDSKKLLPRVREELYAEIAARAQGIGIGMVGEKIIDEINILKATFLAMRQAISNLSMPPDHILVDGKSRIPKIRIPQTPIIGGDDIAQSVAAASVVAKVTRDMIMKDVALIYPGWGFERHKGYGTEEHISLLFKKGPLPIHRKTFEPVSFILGRFA
jgi:ribonuclease HII